MGHAADEGCDRAGFGGDRQNPAWRGTGDGSVAVRPSGRGMRPGRLLTRQCGDMNGMCALRGHMSSTASRGPRV